MKSETGFTFVSARRRRYAARVTLSSRSWLAWLTVSALCWPAIARAQLDVPPEPVLPDKPQPAQQPPAQQPPANQVRQNAAPSTENQPTAQPGPAPRALVTPPAKNTRKYESKVQAHKPSPEWTQDRSFTSTRFWLLDPGNYEVQTWARTRIYSNAPTEELLQQEIEIGLVPHLQIDLYENVINLDANGHDNWSQEGVQIEARVAIPSYYGQVFANPVVYLEFHPRHNAPDRAEVRLLLGGAPTRWLYLAVNPYVETNVEPTDTPSATIVGGMPAVKTTTSFIADLEFGTTVAVGFRLTDWLRVSAETKIGADMLGDPNNQLHFVWWAGPGFIVKPLPARYRQYLKIMGTCLFKMPGAAAAAQNFEPLFILGSQF